MPTIVDIINTRNHNSQKGRICGDFCEFILGKDRFITGKNTMGMYTEINVCFDLLRDTPKDITEILYCLIEGKDTPPILPNHDFFKCDRWDMVACCNSYYFDGLTNSKIAFDNISKTYKINIRANLKNYDSEIEKFLDWLKPYIGTEGFIGYMRYEEWEDPILIYNNFHNDKIIFKNVSSETMKKSL